MAEKFLLIKRGYYYRPNNAGYTASKAEAGIYSRDEAELSCKLCSDVSMLGYEHAEEIAPVCTRGLAPAQSRSDYDLAMAGML